MEENILEFLYGTSGGVRDHSGMFLFIFRYYWVFLDNIWLIYICSLAQSLVWGLQGYFLGERLPPKISKLYREDQCEDLLKKIIFKQFVSESKGRDSKGRWDVFKVKDSIG